MSSLSGALFLSRKSPHREGVAYTDGSDSLFVNLTPFSNSGRSEKSGTNAGIVRGPVSRKEKEVNRSELFF